MNKDHDDDEKILARVDGDAPSEDPRTAATDRGHTPGPWRGILSEIGGEIFVVDDGPGRIVVAEISDQPQLVANIRLIAAAPDLLAALKQLADRHAGYETGVGGCVCPGHMAARAAIAKAEGP